MKDRNHGLHQHVLVYQGKDITVVQANFKRERVAEFLSGHVNSKNNVYWSTAPPEEVFHRQLHSVKCTAWVAISKHGIIGPYWFEDKNEKAQTMNTERYVAVLMKFWTSLGRHRGIDRDDQWFQQDGAIPTHQITPLSG